jgi:hypothetical protein
MSVEEEKEKFLSPDRVRAIILNSVNAECPNAYNGHGKCTSYDIAIGIATGKLY